MTTVWILLLISLVIYELMTMDVRAIFYFVGIILSLLIVRVTPVPNNYILEIVLAVLIGTVLLYFFRDELKKYLDNNKIYGLLLKIKSRKKKGKK